MSPNRFLFLESLTAAALVLAALILATVPGATS